MTLMTDLLSKAKVVFRDGSMGDELAVCAYCCVPSDKVKKLLRAPLAMLSREDIYAYLDAAQVMDDSILIRQMKYLLPRILELMVEGVDLRHSTEITLDKCYFDRAAWTVKEREFMQRFALAYFETQFETDRPQIVAEVVLMFHLAGLDVSHLLSHWLLCLNRYRPYALCGLVELLSDIDITGRCSNAFSNAAFSRKLTQWLSDSQTRLQIVDAIVGQLDAYEAAGLDMWLCEVAFCWLTEWDVQDE